MSHATVESVTAASKLRRDKLVVEDELREKRAEVKLRLERVREREDSLRQQRAELQEELVRFYKYIQDNETKRTRANKKAATEEKAKLERHAKAVELQCTLQQLEASKREARGKHLEYAKYQQYLEEVLQHNDNEEYQDAHDLITRWQTLDDNRLVLQRRKTQLEEELGKNKVSLALRHQRNKSDAVDLQNQLSEKQNQLDAMRQAYKETQDALETDVAKRGATKRIVGQVRMACQNLYDRCVTTTADYRGGKGSATKDRVGSDMLLQLQAVGECLSDYRAVIEDWKVKRAADAAALAAANGGAMPVAAAAASGAAGAAASGPSGTVTPGVAAGASHGRAGRGAGGDGFLDSNWSSSIQSSNRR